MESSSSQATIWRVRHILSGEVREVLEEAGEWLLVKDERGYEPVAKWEWEDI
jgi:hypothetical protein